MYFNIWMHCKQAILRFSVEIATSPRGETWFIYHRRQAASPLPVPPLSSWTLRFPTYPPARNAGKRLIQSFKFVNLGEYLGGPRQQQFNKAQTTLKPSSKLFSLCILMPIMQTSLLGVILYLLVGSGNAEKLLIAKTAT